MGWSGKLMFIYIYKLCEGIRNGVVANIIFEDISVWVVGNTLVGNT